MDLLTILYTISGLVFGMAFVPQIRTLLTDTSGAVAINLSTWVMFSLCSAVTLIYACLHNGDMYFIFCSAICLIGNIVVLTLASLRRVTVPAKTRHPK